MDNIYYIILCIGRLKYAWDWRTHSPSYARLDASQSILGTHPILSSVLSIQIFHMAESMKRTTFWMSEAIRNKDAASAVERKNQDRVRSLDRGPRSRGESQSPVEVGEAELKNLILQVRYHRMREQVTLHLKNCNQDITQNVNLNKSDNIQPFSNQTNKQDTIYNNQTIQKNLYRICRHRFSSPFILTKINLKSKVYYQNNQCNNFFSKTPHESISEWFKYLNGDWR